MHYSNRWGKLDSQAHNFKPGDLVKINIDPVAPTTIGVIVAQLWETRGAQDLDWPAYRLLVGDRVELHFEDELTTLT